MTKKVEKQLIIIPEHIIKQSKKSYPRFVAYYDARPGSEVKG